MVYYIGMENAWTFGSREVLAELEREAREGMELEGEPCDWCGGRGNEFCPILCEETACPRCKGSGIDPEGGLEA